MKKTIATKLAAIGILLKPETYHTYYKHSLAIAGRVKDVVQVSHRRRLKRAFKRNSVPGIIHYLKGVTFKHEHGPGMADTIIKSL